MLLLTLVALTFGLVTGNSWQKGWCDDKMMAESDLADIRLDMKNWATQMGDFEPRHNLPTPEMIAKEGYPAETHVVETEDGYMLTLHRIPYGKNDLSKDDATNRPVVFLQHGLLDSSATWVMATPSKGLGYILADAGYDVWMGNYRGNTYSKGHVTLDPADQRGGFWDFTWDEMGKYDLPAQIEKVLEISGQPDLFYVGHSMGSTGFFAMHKYRPDIAAKVRLANYLSPVAFVGHATGLLKWLAKIDQLLGTVIIDLLGIGEFLPSNIFMDCIATLFCQEGWVTQGLCGNIVFLIVGFDEPQMNNTLLPTLLHHTPAGSSSRTLLHYAQEINSKGFRAYDWGSDEANIQHHGTATPPEYTLKTVTTPTAIHWGDNDWLAMPEDIIRVIMDLPNIMPGMNHEVEFAQWNHLDFMWAIDADKYVYSNLLEDLKTCTEQDCRNMKK